MQVAIKKVTDWSLVLDSARWTVHKQGLDKEPSDKFKRSIIMSEHSPLRELRFHIDIIGLPNFSSQQISRHDNFVGHSHREGSLDQNYVGTNRPDRVDVDPKEVHRLTPVDHKISASAADLIELSKKRLCFGKASKETREAWEAVINELSKTEPILASKCVPSCIYRSFCPEEDGCGYADTELFHDRLNDYRTK